MGKNTAPFKLNLPCTISPKLSFTCKTDFFIFLKAFLLILRRGVNLGIHVKMLTILKERKKKYKFSKREKKSLKGIVLPV